MTDKLVEKSLQAKAAYSKNSIVSTQLISVDGLNATLFAFDKNQMLSAHSSSFPAAIQVIEGTAEITLGEKKHEVKKGGFVFMPKGLKHAVLAKTKMKMLLTLGKP